LLTRRLVVHAGAARRHIARVLRGIDQANADLLAPAINLHHTDRAEKRMEQISFGVDFN
jgi:hypothetical protein